MAQQAILSGAWSQGMTVANRMPITAGTGRGNYYRNGLSLATAPEKGDLNGDGKITAEDVIIALQIAVSGRYRNAADMDENGL